MKEYGLLKMVNGDMEIFEGVLVDAKGSEMEGSQITLTIDNGQALVSLKENDIIIFYSNQHLFRYQWPTMMRINPTT